MWGRNGNLPGQVTKWPGVSLFHNSLRNPQAVIGTILYFNRHVLLLTLCGTAQPLKSRRVFTVSIRFWVSSNSVFLNLLSPRQVWAGEVLSVDAGASQGVAGPSFGRMEV